MNAPQQVVFGDPGPDYGLWWRRVGAQIIDSLILMSPILLVIIVAIISDSTAVGLILLLLIVLWWFAAVFYAPLLMMREGAVNGQTWGKQAMKIRVIRDPEETPYTFGPAFVRQVLVIGVLFGALGWVLVGIPVLADYLWPLWDKQNRALHDMVVDSRVIRVVPEVTQ